MFTTVVSHERRSMGEDPPDTLHPPYPDPRLSSLRVPVTLLSLYIFVDLLGLVENSVMSENTTSGFEIHFPVSQPDSQMSMPSLFFFLYFLFSFW